MNTWRRSVWGTVVASVVTTGCAHRPPGGVSPEPNGCFQVILARPLVYPLPSHLELRRESSSCAFARGDFEAVGSADGGNVATGIHGHWRPLDSGQVDLRWGTDFAGVELHLRSETRGFQGTATIYRDVGDDLATSEVLLERATCPAASALPNSALQLSAASVATLPLTLAAERQYR